LRREVEKAIARIRPYIGLAIVELVDVSDGVARVRVIPHGCSAAHPLYHIPEDMVLSVLEDQIREDVPEIRQVVAVE